MFYPKWTFSLNNFSFDAGVRFGCVVCDGTVSLRSRFRSQMMIDVSFADNIQAPYGAATTIKIQCATKVVQNQGTTPSADQATAPGATTIEALDFDDYRLQLLWWHGGACSNIRCCLFRRNTT